MKIRKKTEKDIQNEIIQYLSHVPGYYWRNNTGAALYKSTTSAGSRARYIRFGHVGSGDITGIGPGGVRVEIEVKRPGGVQSENQKAFQKMITDNGGVYILAYSVEDVAQKLNDKQIFNCR
jgi:hypothetical protein